MSDSSALALFHPTIQRWFASRHAAPTTVQAQSWPVIAKGGHALITAPTGSGKTLTAFLWSINRFLTGDLTTGQTRVVYVSPLKALNNDIRVNLTEPLVALREDVDLPHITVGVRSGDTSTTDRRRMLRQPPDILITTPESLHLMLTNVRGRASLASVCCVIIDEVHALVNNRRGAQLSVCMERLTLIAGEFQRIALSATVHPLELVATWVAAFDAQHQPRPITTVAVNTEKKIDFRVRFPVEARQAAAEGKKIWEPLGDEFAALVERNRSTLFFTNSRRLAEKITLRINDSARSTVAYAHHGSLSREIRTEVEQRLKAGELRAIVATNSLEMGIDIGSLDEVVMVQSPPGIAQTLQRVGRAGHQVGATSRGTLYPSHSRDLIDAAVLAHAVRDRDLEPIRLQQAPLDILVQIIISMCAHESWHLQALFDVITRASAYRHLDYTLFMLVIDMLSGRFAGARLRELRPRVHLDHTTNTVSIAKGALFAMYSSGGSIPDRGYFTLRLSDGGAAIGELDEEFVWEATIGQSFTLGTQGWTIQQITHNDVLVRPAGSSAPSLPFWRSETIFRNNHFSERIGRFLGSAEQFLAQRDPAGLQASIVTLGFDDSGAEALTDFLVSQRRVTGAPLPDRYHLLIELAAGGPDGYRGPDAPRQLILHTLWGGELNQPFALALRAALGNEGWEKPEVYADNDAVVVQCRDWPDAAFILGLVTADNLTPLLRASLESSGHFGARFRESAQRSLLLAKPRFNQRLPLWMSRMQAKKLLTTVKRFEDFPVLLETWRTCLQDEFDLGALRNRLHELSSGEIRWTAVRTNAPSPFASSIRFEQISPLMYGTDEPEDPGASGLRQDLIASAVAHAELRPQLSRSSIDAFIHKRQRLLPGYVPTEADDLEAWVRERVLMQEVEWSQLLALSGLSPNASGVLFRIQCDSRRWITHRDFLSVFALLADHVEPLISGTGLADKQHTPAVLHLVNLYIEVLSFHGPLTRSEIETLLPTVPDVLWRNDALIADVVIEGSAVSHWCERDNLEILFRLQRSRQRYALDPLPARKLPAFLARLHGLAQSPISNAFDRRLVIGEHLQRLAGFTAPVSVWLEDLLAARIGDGPDGELAEVIATEGLNWRGNGNERVQVGTIEETDLFGLKDLPDADALRLFAAFRDPSARYSFNQISDESQQPVETLNQQWWHAVWAGWLATDEWSSLQQAARRKFQLTDVPSGTTVSTMRRRARGIAIGWPGSWRLLHRSSSDSPMREFEDAKSRVRILLDRYGFANRELVTREGQSWSACFRALRVMELAGEVSGGLFFQGLSGPQFALPSTLHRLREPMPSTAVWWVNATDCASPCGLGLAWPELPQRRSANYLAFIGEDLALVVENGGKSLRFLISPEHPSTDEVLAVLVHIARGRRRFEVHSINDAHATDSPWLVPLDRILRVQADHKRVELEARETPTARR